MNPELNQVSLNWGFIAYKIACEAANLASHKTQKSSQKLQSSYKFSELDTLKQYPFEPLLRALLAAKHGFAKTIVLRPFKINQSNDHEWTFFWGESIQDPDIQSALTIASKAKDIPGIKMSTEVIEDRSSNFLQPYILNLRGEEIKIPETQIEAPPSEEDSSLEAAGKKQMQAFADAISSSIVITIPAWIKIDDKDVKSGTMIIYGSNEFPMEDLWQIVSAYHSGGLMYLGAFEHQKHLVLQRSHEKLLKLQTPLDALTKAFFSVQAEAHEMQAILNSPEESLFRAQKLVADIFVDQKSIKVSDTLTAKPAHVPDELNDPDLQMLYVLVLCSIFGRRADLRAANSSAAVLGYGRDVLRDAERSPVFDDLCALVRLVTEAEQGRASIAETIDALPGETDTKRIGRQRKVLTRLKMLLFEPFKDFSSIYWPKAPFVVAVEGKRAQLDCLTTPQDSRDLNTRLAVRHEFSPFPQHGILDFILSAKGEFENRGAYNSFAKTVISENSDNRAVLKIDYDGELLFDETKSSNHFSFLCHAADHGVSGSNFGNFLGSYSRMLRHAYSLGSSLTASSNADWQICDPKNSTISLAIERRDKRRFFWIEHTHSARDGKGTLSLVWSECGWKNGKPESGSAETSAACGAPAPAPQAVTTPPQSEPAPTYGDSADTSEPPSREVMCFISDHNQDGPWANALMDVALIQGKRGTVKFVGKSVGIDRPAEVKISEGVQVLILHTHQIDNWLHKHGSRYAIVRVSTDPASLTLPKEAPNSIKLLMNVVPNYFQLAESKPQRRQAVSALLKAVFDALDAYL